MFIGAHEAEYMFVTTLLKIEQHLLAQGRCPYSYLGRDPSPPPCDPAWGCVSSQFLALA